MKNLSRRDFLKGALASTAAVAASSIVGAPVLAEGVKIVFDPTLVRGMGYYTGAIFEITMDDYNFSIAGGGRYDKMIGKFSGLQLDGYMGVLVALFIIWSGICLIKETSDPLLGLAPDPTLVKQLGEKIMAYEGILGIHDLVVHDYGPGKTLIFLVVTVVGALIIIFLLLVFFSLLGDAASYFISLYREIAFRLY